jgi:hypothetical protein
VPLSEPGKEPGPRFPLPGVPVTRIVNAEGDGHEKPSGQVTIFVTNRVSVWGDVGSDGDVALVGVVMAGCCCALLL